MKKWMFCLMAVLFVATQAAAQQPPPPARAPQPGEIPQIVAYDNEGLLGDHIHIFHIPADLVVDQWVSDGASNSRRDFLILSDV